MGPPSMSRHNSVRYEVPAKFPSSLSFAADSGPQRRIFRGPAGRRGSFERHMLEGLFIKAFCVAAFSGHDRDGDHEDSQSGFDLPDRSFSASSKRALQSPVSPQSPKLLRHQSGLCRPCRGEQRTDEIVRRIRKPRWKDGIPREHLEVICEEEKGRLLEGVVPVPEGKLEEAADVVGRLHALSPGLTKMFKMKAASREDLVFRLLFPHPHPTAHRRWKHGSMTKDRRAQEDGRGLENGDGGGDGEDVAGYYALSYRWQSQPEAPDPRVANCNKYAAGIPPERFVMAPVSDEMFEAIMEELPDSSQGRYGLWCDQVCIDESNDEERTLAVGMMDAIYRAAEKVIIALDDVEITVEEMDAMIEFSAWHDHHTENGRIPEDQDLWYMRDKPKLRGGVEKIIYSEYFDRAWCAHEFELARDRIVLVRTEQRSPDGRVKVVRIEDDKLHSLMLLLTLLERQQLTPMQAARRVNVELLASRDARDDPDDPQRNSPMVHDMQTLSLIFTMKNGGDPTLPEELRPYSAVRDKMSIMLNASDLALIPAKNLHIQQLSVDLAHARIYEYISLLMLAGGNPLILATTSEALPADDEHDTWLRKFWLLDAGIDANLPRLERPLPIRVDPAPGSRWIELDMLFPAASTGGGILHTASDKFLKHAGKFISDFRSTNSDTIDVAGETHPISVLEDRREYMTHLLACILECRWTWGYGPFPRGMTTPSPTSPFAAQKTAMKARKKMKYSSERSWDYFFGFDGDLETIGESWDSKKRDENEQKTAKAMAGELMSGLLMTDPLPESRGDASSWRPAWFEIGGPHDAAETAAAAATTGQDPSQDPALMSNRSRYIAMVPRDARTYRAAIPQVLQATGYASLARCWVLEDTADADCWVVRNRSKLIMESDALEQELEDGMWERRPRQRVWGRTRASAADEAG